MLQVFKVFPLWLVAISLILVIIPTILCALMRIALHKHLQNLVRKTRNLVENDTEGIPLKLVRQLRERFEKASKQLEYVNTVALIDGTYSQQETFRCFGYKWRCEEGEYITKILPNLLLAFGLLGTFLGITINLYEISRIINQNGGNIVDLTDSLQTPLQSMGIAFVSSLIALLCSSALTIINLRYNSNLAKNSLLNNLEDYLDNIYKPLVEGDTRLDKAVNKMVSRQEEFLTEFHERVGEVLENTFSRAANRIANDNEKAQQLAVQVYQGLMDASSAINTGANNFKNSMITLENQVESLQRMMPILRQNVEDFHDSSNKILTAANQIEASKFSENLERLTIDLAETEKQFSNSTNSLNDCVSIFTKENQKATELAQQVYQQFQLSSNSLEESAIIFADSATAIKDSKFNENLVNATGNLDTIQKQFNEMAISLNKIVKPIEINVKTLELSADKMVKLSDNIDDINSNINNINSRYVEMSNISQEIWQETQINLMSYIEIIEKIQQQLPQTMITILTNQKDILSILNNLNNLLDNSLLPEIKNININSVNNLNHFLDYMNNINSIQSTQKNIASTLNKLNELLGNN